MSFIGRTPDPAAQNQHSPVTSQVMLSPMRPSALKVAIAARRYLKARRWREAMLPNNMFADPAWDILLDLYASESEGLAVSVSDACHAASVPATTALRWLSRLEQAGLIERSPDPLDARRIFLTPKEPARTVLHDWLAGLFIADRV